MGFVGEHPEPSLKIYTQIMNAGMETAGFYDRDEVCIYIHRDHSKGQSDYLLQTMLEEIAHHITGAADGSRDFQDFLLRVTTRAMNLS
jgi:hypothetical protein